MSILSNRSLNKPSPAARKKSKTKRVVIFTDEINKSKTDKDISSDILTPYALEHKKKTKFGVNNFNSKGIQKHIIKVPKEDFKKNIPLIKPDGNTPTTPKETKKLTKYNRGAGRTFTNKQKFTY